MKKEDRQYLSNLVNYARNTYIKVFTSAFESAFTDRNRLDKLDDKTFNLYIKYKNRPKRVVKLLTYIAAHIYNEEIIVVPDIWSDIAILHTIIAKRLYTVKKFKTLMTNDGIKQLLNEGVRYGRIMNSIKEISGGIQC